MPRPIQTVSRVILGVTTGVLVDVQSLNAIGRSPVGVAVVLLGTLAASFVTARVLSRLSGMEPATAQLGMIAGGASNVVAVSDDIGADARLVAVMQYVRLYIVVLALPLAAWILPGESGNAPTDFSAKTGSTLAGLLLLAGAGVVAVVLQRFAPIPSGTLLVPMIIAAGVTLMMPGNPPVLPLLLSDAGLVLIGIEVGLQFTTTSLKAARSLLPAIAAMMVALILVCAGLGVLLSWITGTSLLDGYLATTPGGLFAVLGVAVKSDVDPAFISSLQVLRLLAMMALAPALGIWIRSRSRRAG
jgi:membrane AbrB-like protein